MTSRENLLVVASEECGELQQEIAKILRFGPENHNPSDMEENQHKFLTEFYQLEAVVDRLVEVGCVYPISSEEIRAIKARKLEQMDIWAEKSRQFGCIKEE